MITTLQFQIVFYSLCGVIIALATASYFRRRRRERLLSQSPHEELNRLDQLELQLKKMGSETPENSNPRSSSATGGNNPEPLQPALADVAAPALSIVKSESGRGVTAGQTADTRSGAADNRDGLPVYQPRGHATTSWSDRALFTSATSSGWKGSSAIPRIEARDVPNLPTDDYTFGTATPVLASFLPETDNARRTLTRELKQAGEYAPHALENLAATRFLFMVGSLLFGGACVLLAPRAVELPLLVGTMALTALGWALPPLLIKSRARTRRTEIERAIPDMMDMLNMCVSQGLTVPDSLDRIATDLKPVYPALSKELSIVVDQTKVGTLNEGLQNFADRIDIPQVDSFVSLVTQTERMGTSVSEALSDYSDNMRESLRQRADERANQASFALLFPTVFCLMPAVFMFLMGPAVIELSKFSNAGGLRALDEGRRAVQNVNRPARQTANQAQ